MGRANTLWQAVILFLVLCLTLGIYALLVVVARPLLSRAPAVAEPPAEAAPVQITSPLPGAVVQSSATITVQVAIGEVGLVRAELLADDRVLAAEANPDPQTVPWLVEFAGQKLGEGAHRLAVQAHGPEGQLVTSAPVDVTGVPGGRLVFASNRDGAYALYAMGTDGAGLARLTTGPGDARQPVWQPGGGLAFGAEDAAGLATIRHLAAGGGGGEALVPGRDPAWAPGGKRLAYASSLEGVSQVFVVRLDDRLPEARTAEAVYAGQPAWSPAPLEGGTGGQQLAYVAERQRNLDIWLVASGGGGPLRLTDDPATDWAPAWSPDGTHLAFVSDRGGSYQIYRMRADGSGVERLTDFPQGAEAPAWSPDGYWLAFVAYTGAGSGVDAREIYLMRADGREPVRLTHNANDDTEPDWADMP